MTGNEKTIIIGWALMSLAMVLLLSIKEAWLFYMFAVLFGVAFAGISSQRPPIVAMLLPVVIDWCRRHRVSPSKLLIPLS